MCNAVVKDNKMASMPINKLLINMGVPMIISMMLQAVYNIVDSAFVANMEGTGVGVNALLAKSMGQGDTEKASRTAGNGVFIMAVIYVVFLLFVLFGTESYISSQTKNPVIGQIASALCGLVFHLKANKEIRTGLFYMKPSGKIIKGIYSIGFAAIIAQALMSLMTYLLNVIFVRIGENVVTAYGLYYKIQQFILFAAFGLRDAITPIVSFNHGRGSRERVMDGVKYGLLYTLGIMLIGFAQRDPDGKCGAPAFHGGDMDFTAVFCDDRLGDREPQSLSAVFPVCCVEAAENIGKFFFWYAAAGIGYINAGI